MSRAPGKVFKRGAVWWLDFTVDGERYRESSGAKKKADALAKLRQRIAEVEGGVFVPQSQTCSVEELRLLLETHYRTEGRKSLKRAMGAFKHLKRLLGRYEARAITYAVVGAYIAARQEEGAANSTIRKELAALKLSLKLAHLAGRIGKVPALPSLSVDNTRTNWLDEPEIRALRGALPADYADAVEFAAWTGWRKAEVFNLTWDRVDWSAGEVRLEVGTTKNREGRTFPFSALPKLVEVLERRREVTDQVERATDAIVRHVFHVEGAPFSSHFYRVWRKAAKAAGVPDAWFHDLRRSAVRRLERAGVSRSVAMKLTGHKTEAIYRRYAIADRKALEEGVEKLRSFAEGAGEGRRKVVPMKRAAGGNGHE